MSTPTVTIACVGCGGHAIKIPSLQAPSGYGFDAALVIVHCGDCGQRQSLDDCTRVTL